jgi:hypothetical protein
MTYAVKLSPRAGTSATSGNFVVTTLSIFLVLLFVYVLPPPYPIQAGLEWSWQAALTNAFLNGAQFGRDLVFTYGPWGFLATPRGDPRIYPWLVLTRLLMAAGFASGVALIGVTRIPYRAARYAWIGLLLLLASPIAVAPMLLFVTSIHLKNVRQRAWYVTVWLLVLSCALVIWVKFTLCILIAALCCLSTAQDLLNRKLPLIATGIAIAGSGFWILANQSLSNVPEYFRNSLYVAGSYSSAMGLAGSKVELVWGALVCACVVVSYALTVSKNLRVLPGAIWVCVFCFLNFKQAFARQDDYHTWLGLIDALLPGALILSAGTGSLDRMKIAALGNEKSTPVIRTLAVTPIILSVLVPFSELRTNVRAEHVQDLAWRIRAVFSQVTPAQRRMAYQRDLESIRRENRIQPIQGTADFFPNDLAEVFASGAMPRLRPALQGYASYNARLTAMNAEFLQSPRRPSSVLFDVNPIDNNYPALEDPLSIFSYLSCYEPTGFTGKYLLLRATICREAARELLLDTWTAPEQWLTIPSAKGPIWAEIEINPNALGKLTDFVLRMPSAELVIETETEQRKYRLTRESAKTGFLLSPVLNDVVSFASLYHPDQDAGTKVRSMIVSFPFGSARYYEKKLRVRLYALRVPERDRYKIIPPASLQFARSVRSRLEMHNTQAKVTSRHGDVAIFTSLPGWIVNGGHAYIQVGASSEGDVEVNQGAHSLQVKFGMDNNDCADMISPWLRARFDIIWTGGASPTTLFSKVVEARGDAKASEWVSLALPGQPGRIILRTEAEGGNCPSGVWWSDLDIR